MKIEDAEGDGNDEYYTKKISKYFCAEAFIYLFEKLQLELPILLIY